MIAALAFLLLQGVAPPVVTATVDHNRVTVGEEIILSVRAVSRSQEPMQVTMPPLDGFEIVARSERTEVSLAGTASRSTTLEIRLRALRTGTWRLGPVTARQGPAVGRASEIPVSVVAGGTAAAVGISPRLRVLIERAPPPRRPGEAALTLVLSADTVYIGDQVDVVTAAWFPRDLRSQLRRPPTLQPPAISGVWSYPQPAPPGIAASRQIGGIWYDLFLAHQIVFPLVPGTVDVTRASLRYSVPVALQFFSQEERYTLESNAATLTVLPLPTAGRPANFSGAVGRGLTIERTMPASGRVGDASTVDVLVSGSGNVSLWPAPDLRWPESVRAYQDQVSDRIAATAGRLGGTKEFSFLAVPDSAGPLTLPRLEYVYFDLDARAYRAATAGAASVMIAPASEAGTSRPQPPPLMAAGTTPVVTRLAGDIPPAAWYTLAFLPPLLFAGGRLAARRRGRRHRRMEDHRPDVHDSDRRLLVALRSLVPDAESRSGSALVMALRAAGVETAVATRIAGVREAFLAARYGPGASSGPSGHAAALSAEMDELTRTLGGSARHRERRAGRGGVAAGMLLIVLAGGGGRAEARQTGPEQLYEAGAVRAAADGFARRAALEPAVAAHWYGLGAAQYRLGAEGRATAAWLRAARAAPRARTVRRALGLVPAPDPVSARRLWTPPVTAAELGVTALVLWLAGWGILLFSRHRRRLRGTLLVLGGGVIGAAGLALHLDQRRPLAIVSDAGPMRLSPHGRAPEVAVLGSGAAVRPQRRQGRWVLVQGPDGRGGWMPGEALAWVRE